MNLHIELITFEAASLRLGIPKTTLLREAEAKGFVVKIGARTKRFPAHLIREFISACQTQPNPQASNSAQQVAAKKPSGQSEIVAAKSAQAQQIATRLKSRSQNTSI